MYRFFWIALMLAATGLTARADDGQVPPPPEARSPIQPGTMGTMTRADIEQLIDQAVQRTLARMSATPSPQSQAALASPQAAIMGPTALAAVLQPTATLTAHTALQAQVLVHP